MPKGKPWPPDQEKQLRDLVKAGKDVETIAGVLKKSTDAIVKKCARLGLEVVDAKAYTTTTSLKLPKELPSIEDTLKILAGALKASTKPDLDKVEVQRLQVVATLARTYKDLLADYVNYRGIEAKLVDLEAKYEKLCEEKSKGNASRANSSAMAAAPA